MESDEDRDGDRALLREQLDYYRARAGEYDEWWERSGRYDRGPQANARWRAEIAELRAVFARLPLGGRVLELAAGTGYWTALLAARAREVTVLDGSEEMMAINRARLGRLADRVEYRQVDLFGWQPEQRWDALVFCFWISHVPRHRLATFLRSCRAALHEGASLFFVDGQPTPEGTARDHVLPGVGQEVMARRLNDGREFRIVKNFYGPDELARVVRHSGFRVQVHNTDTFFQYGVGTAC